MNDKARFLAIGNAAMVASPAVLYFSSHIAVATQQPWAMALPTACCLAVMAWAFRRADGKRRSRTASQPQIERYAPGGRSGRRAGG